MRTLGPTFHQPLAAPLPPPPTVTGKVTAVTGKLADNQSAPMEYGHVAN